MKNKLLEIIKHYGIDEQLKYIHNEYFELDEAIVRYENGNTLTRDYIKEELADVMVMLKQFQYFYDITDEDIEEVMNYKIDRQLHRIKGE